MKFLKNNKGVTGIDIVMSILIIIVSVTLITIMYSKYIEKSKEIKRNTTATNIAMKVIDKIENTKFDDITDELIEDNFEINDETGYTIRVKKVEEIENVSIKFKVEVEYKIGNKSETIELSTTKTKGSFQANIPDMSKGEVKKSAKTINVSNSTGDTTTGEYTRYVLKYSNTKKGYIKANTTDDDWYSISGKKFAVIAYAKESPIPFNTNGVIDFNECSEIYVWVPRFIKDANGKYRFCYEQTNNPIIYKSESDTITISDSTYSVAKYIADTSNTTGITEYASFKENEVNMTGKWVRVNSDFDAINTDDKNILNILKTKEFTWEE